MSDSAPTTPALQIKELRVDYGEVVAVDDLNLEIAPGEIYGLVGPNGAGKTSTFRVLATLLKPTYGEVSFCGIDLDLRPAAVRRILGYMPDLAPAPSDIRVWEFLDLFAGAYGLPKGERRERVDECLQIVNLADQRNVICRTLSRGMTQRLVLAKTLLHRPRVLVLDEPASGMDPMSRVNLRNTLRTLAAGGATILASSHILSELAEMCTSLGILMKGKLLISGSADYVRRTLGGGKRIITAAVLDEASAEIAMAELSSTPNVTALSRNKLILRFEFDGSDPEQAAILSRLVTARASVRRFEESMATFEDLVVQLSKEAAA